MSDEEQIKQLYKYLCNASINKNKKLLDEILADGYILIHMTGKHQTKQEYIHSVMNGELKYFESVHESIEVKVNGNDATLIGKTKTLASPFGFGKSWWNLRQDLKLKKIDGNWLICESRASSY